MPPPPCPVAFEKGVREREGADVTPLSIMGTAASVAHEGPAPPPLPSPATTAATPASVPGKRNRRLQRRPRGGATGLESPTTVASPTAPRSPGAQDAVAAELTAAQHARDEERDLNERLTGECAGGAAFRFVRYGCDFIPRARVPPSPRAQPSCPAPLPRVASWTRGACG